MKKSTKLLTVGLVLCGMGAGLWLYIIFSAPMITLDEAQAQAEAEALATAVEPVEEAEAEEEPYDYTITYTPEEPEEEIPEELLPSVTETVNEDGSVTIDRTWGVKPEGAVTIDDPDGADANMGSGGGEVPVDEDGIYWGEDTASVPETTVEPEPEETTTTTPKDGDRKVDETGQEWVYSDIFGWITSNQGGGGLIEVETDIVPGQGEIIGSWG